MKKKKIIKKLEEALDLEVNSVISRDKEIFRLGKVVNEHEATIVRLRSELDRLERILSKSVQVITKCGEDPEDITIKNPFEKYGTVQVG